MSEKSVLKSKPTPIDAAVKVRISTDYLEAKVYIEPPKYGGKELTPEVLDKALSDAGVVYGIDAQTMQKIKAKPQYSCELLLACGKPAIRGVDGTIKYYYVETGSKGHPKVREDGTVDYRDLSIVSNVKAGQVLADITLPTNGTEGIAVTGRKLAPVPGKAVSSPVGRNTQLSEDGTKLLAEVNGHVSLNGTRVNLVETFIVPKNVDNSTGNIKSVCNVTVCENVLEGFTIEAEGNVEIGGTVEGGSIKSGGSIKIQRGIVGRGRSRIECIGDFSSTFIENCEVNAGGSIKAESIMNSSIRCTGKLELEGYRAKLMGGRCVVGQDIIANQIGSPAYLRTELILGVEPAIMTHYAALAAEIKSLNENIIKLNQIVELLEKYEKAGTLPSSKKRMLVTSKISLQTSLNKLRSDNEEYDKLSGQIQNSGFGKVICRGTMHHGVKLTIGCESMDVDNDITSSSFSLVDGKIVVTPVSPY